MNKPNLATAFKAFGVRLPLRLSDEDVGVALDANDFDVLTVDVNSTLPDSTVAEIARLVVMAVNVAAVLSAPPARQLTEGKVA